MIILRSQKKYYFFCGGEDGASEDDATCRAFFASMVPSAMGHVRVGQKRPRGVRGATNTSAEGFLNVDVTSGSMNKINGAPLTLDP